MADQDTLARRFQGVIQRAHEQTGRRVVVLVDEYDKPLLQAIGHSDLTESYKSILKAFYGVLKSTDAHLKFVLLTEVKSAKGRADAVVHTDSRVFVFEFKLNGTAEQALAQIDAQGYAVTYQAQGREVVKVGVEFDKETRNLGRWLIG